MIKELLEKRGIKYITPETQDCDIIFQNDPQYQVFLGQVSQGIGITLTRAARTIYYSLTTSLRAYLQSMDRNYRIGQDKKVLIEHMFYPGGVDQSLLFLLSAKQDVSDYINTKAECVCCPQLRVCLDRFIHPYAEGCIYYGSRMAAEQRNRLAYGTI